jgi:hypothetical protein
MTGFKHSTFRHKCPDDGCYINRLPSWDYMDGCFPRGIIPTDVDGMVEINGSFLFLEEKRANACPPPGQLAALKSLSRLDRVHVALLRPSAVSEMQLLVLRNGCGTGWQDVTREDIRWWLAKWGDAADLGRTLGEETDG